jgi:hypothetical protein
MPNPVLTLGTYEARSGCEEELAGILRTHVARLRELDLVADLPHFAAARADAPQRFIESFRWAHEGAAELARDQSEVQELWMRLEDLCVLRGIGRIELVPLD